MINRNNTLRYNDTALNHHAITGMALDVTACIFSITVGSWLSKDAAAATAPSVSTVLDVWCKEWSADYSEKAKDIVEAHPEWTGLPPLRPGPNHLFDMGQQAWVDLRTLQDLKAAKWSEIKQARNTAELSNFTYNDKVLNGDLHAQRRLSAYISVSKSALASGTEFSAAFTLADNTETVFTAQDFVGIELAKVQAVAAVFAKGVWLRNQIEQASTDAELDSIAW